MPNHRTILSSTSCFLFCAACTHGGDAIGGPGEPTTTGSTSASSSPPSTAPTATEPPTTSATSTGDESTGAAETAASPASSTGGGSGGGTSGEPPAPSCGDAVVGPGEECDLGLIENSDLGACTVQCKLAVCGDGLVWTGHEACDHGPDNNDDLYGGCTTQCQFGARCGDGVLQSPEECDLSDDNGTGEHAASGVPCSAGCRFQARVVFLTSTTYNGGELGGVEGAHLKCQALAKQAQLDNAAKFMAWLSDAQHSPLQDFKHDLDTLGLAYVLPNGVRIADDWTDLVLHGPGDGIVLTETGELLLKQKVWTGTAPSGKVFDPAATCKAWSSSSPFENSRIGRSGVPTLPADVWMQWDAERQWTNHSSAGCHLPGRLYCVEQ